MKSLWGHDFIMLSRFTRSRRDQVLICYEEAVSITLNSTYSITLNSTSKGSQLTLTRLTGNQSLLTLFQNQIFTSISTIHSQWFAAQNTTTVSLRAITLLRTDPTRPTVLALLYVFTLFYLLQFDHISNNLTGRPRQSRLEGCPHAR